MQTKDELLHHLQTNSQVFQNTRVQAAFTAVDRADFVMEEYVIEAYEDYPLPIGFDQTISQPTTVAFMLELLDPQEGSKVLDVGAGSGWTTALLAAMIGEKGSVLGVEVIPELVTFAQSNLAKYDFSWATIEQADGKHLGAPTEAPFDHILVSAQAEKDIPEVLIDQLAVGGTIVIPVDDDIVFAKKQKDGTLLTRPYPGFVFVPLVVPE